MNTSQLTCPLPASESVVPTLPQSTTSKNLPERPLSAALGDRQREMSHAAADPGQIEYESWLPHFATARH